jgi:hypothetical protein
MCGSLQWGGACLGVWEFLFKVGDVVGGSSISQVRPEDKMATNSQNGEIIVLSETILEIVQE